MNGVRPGLITALAVVAALGTGKAGAGPREAFAPLPTEATEIIEPAIWSKRLLGRFKFDGVIHHDECVEPDNGGVCTSINEWSQPVEGKGDCIDFAEGPGLQCVINVVWPEMWREETGKAQLGGVSDLTPAMVLAGFVTTTPGGIRVLLVNDKGLGHPGAMTLKGNVAGAKPPCVNMPGMQRCDQRFSITARADEKTIFVQLGTTTRFIRSKLDRKQFLEPEERSTEWAEEWLDVSFALRREEPGAEDPGAVTTPASR